mmetsp:Transcript_39405/g.124476  ORF Transcript_39405/g.124476 Transcript_39405/m.124476 type:complete len:473 (-) Transcript_39405:1477-2895(-)
MPPSKLFEALHARDAKRVKHLVSKEGCDVNETGAGEQTALHLAAELDNVECVQLLLTHGASVGMQDGQMRTPLLAACVGNCRHAARALIEAGAPLGTGDEDENTPLHWLALHDAVDLAKLALEKGAPLEALNAAVETPLLLAAKHGRTAAVRLLLSEGATIERDSVGSIAPTNKTACHFAMQYGAEGGDAADASAMLVEFLNKSPDVNATDGEKRTALHYAVVNDELLPSVQALLSAGAAVDQKDWAGLTPLHWAAFLGAAKNVRALLAAGAAAQAADHHQRTALHRAAERNDEECLAALLAADGVSVDATDADGLSALHYAARAGGVGCVRALLAAAADRSLPSLAGKTAADLTGSREVHEALRESGAPGLKRARSSSAARLPLPDLASKVYAACATRSVESVLPLCTPSLAAQERPALEALVAQSPPLAVEQMHAASGTSTVAVEHAQGLHLLAFSEEGLLERFCAFARS